MMFHSCIKNSQWDEHDPSLLAILWNSWRNTKISFTKIITRVRHYIETFVQNFIHIKKTGGTKLCKKVQWEQKIMRHEHFNAFFNCRRKLMQSTETKNLIIHYLSQFKMKYVEWWKINMLWPINLIITFKTYRN